MRGPETIWAAIRERLDHLDEQLSRQGRLVTATISTRYQLGDEHHPRSVVARLGADLEIPTEQEVALAFAFRCDFAALITRTEIKRPGSYLDDDFELVASTLLGEGSASYSAVLPRDSSFWDLRSQAIADSGSTKAVESIDEAISTDPLTKSLSCLGLAYDVLRPGVDYQEGLTHLAGALLIDRDLSIFANPSADEAPPIIAAAAAETAGLHAGEVTRDVAMGVMLAHRLHESLVQRWRAELEAARQAVNTGEAMAGYLAFLESRLGDFRARIDGGGGVLASPSWAPRIESGSVSTLDETVEMGRAFLMTDPELGESWEVHRRPALGSEAVSRFPAGLVLETLARHGFNVTDRIDRLLDSLERQGFAYYDHPRLAFADTDTVGLALRLKRFATDQDLIQTMTDELVDRVWQVVAGDRIPVWIDAPPDQDVLLSGEGCAAVEAGFLLGLAHDGWTRHAAKAESPLRRLLRDFIELGTGISVNYPPAFFLATLTRLLSALGNQDGEVWDRVRSSIEALDHSSPQTRALLVIITSAPKLVDLFKPHWVDRLIDEQRPDGSWTPEPLFYVNGRGGAPTWYSSATVTTALCWDALATHLTTLSNDHGPGLGPQ